MQVESFDHIVLTVQDIDRSILFYTEVLGMKAVTFGKNRKALTFGTQKINLTQAGHSLAFSNKPTCGAADFCLVTKVPIDQVIEHLKTQNVKINAGPVKRTGAKGPIVSVYFNDPDCNLIEVCNYLS